MESKTLTIMFTDIKDYTKRTRVQSREDNLLLLERHEEIIRPSIGKFKGKIIKTLGDSFLVVFESPTNALLSAIEIQKKLWAYNADLADSDQMIELRISLNSGEVTLLENDIAGDAVNIAARVEGITETGEIFFTEAVYLTMNKSEIPFTYWGETSLKGIPEPIKIYKVSLGVEISKNLSSPAIDPPPKPPKPIPQKPNFMEDIEFKEEKIDPSQMGKVFDFTNVEFEKKFEENSSPKERSSDTETVQTLELSNTALDPDPNFKKSGMTVTQKTKSQSNQRPDPQIEHSKELLIEIRRKKSDTKKSNFLYISLIILFLLGTLTFYLYFTASKTKQSEESLKRELENSVLLQALNKKSPEPTPESTNTLKPITSIEYGSVSIKSSPNGAIIWINNKKLGNTTPILLKKVDPSKNYHLVIKKTGFKPHDVFFDIAPGEHKEIEVRLSK